MIAKEQSSTQAGTRRLRWIGGTRRTKQEQKPCAHGLHEGPLLNTERYDTFPDAVWHGFGECACCRSTIHVSQLRRAA